MRARIIGSRKTVPPRMLRIVPFGLFHISFSLNSFTRASSGVIVAHLMPTLCLRIASAASTVTLSFVCDACIRQDVDAVGLVDTYRVTVLQAQVVVLDVQLKVRKNELETHRGWVSEDVKQWLV